MEEKCTIVIPTKERKELLLNKLMCYQKLGLRSKIIIVDSSENSIASELKYQELDITYIHKILPARLALLLGYNSTDTEYVCFEGDDDLFVPLTIAYFVEKLETNRNYVAAVGKGIRVFEDISLKNKLTIGTPIPYPDKKLSLFDKKLRINILKESFFASQYAITRTNVINEIVGLYNMSGARIIEYLHGYLLANEGPIFVSNKIFRIQYMTTQVYENTWGFISEKNGIVNDLKVFQKQFSNYDLNEVTNFLFFLRTKRKKWKNNLIGKVHSYYNALKLYKWQRKSEKYLNRIGIKNTSIYNNKYFLYKFGKVIEKMVRFFYSKLFSRSRRIFNF